MTFNNEIQLFYLLHYSQDDNFTMKTNEFFYEMSFFTEHFFTEYFFDCGG